MQESRVRHPNWSMGWLSEVGVPSRRNQTKIGSHHQIMSPEMCPKHYAKKSVRPRSLLTPVFHYPFSFVSSFMMCWNLSHLHVQIVLHANTALQILCASLTKSLMMREKGSVTDINCNDSQRDFVPVKVWMIQCNSISTLWWTDSGLFPWPRPIYECLVEIAPSYFRILRKWGRVGELSLKSLQECFGSGRLSCFSERVRREKRKFRAQTCFIYSRSTVYATSIETFRIFLLSRIKIGRCYRTQVNILRSHHWFFVLAQWPLYLQGHVLQRMHFRLPLYTYSFPCSILRIQWLQNVINGQIEYNVLLVCATVPQQRLWHIQIDFKTPKRD